MRAVARRRASLRQLDPLAGREQLRIEVWVGLLELLERDAGLLGDLRRRVAGLDDVDAALALAALGLGRRRRRRRARAARRASRPPCRGCRPTRRGRTPPRTAASASGARNRAGFRPAIAGDDSGATGGFRPVAQACSRRRSASARAASAGSPPCCSWAPAIEREAVTRPAARPGANAGASERDVAALGADAGQQERRARHQLAHPAQVLGGGGAGDRADVGEAVAVGTAEAGDERGHVLPQRAAGGQRRGRTGRPRPGWRCARARTRRRRAARAPSTSGASASRPSSGLAVTASAPRPATGP